MCSGRPSHKEDQWSSMEGGASLQISASAVWSGGSTWRSYLKPNKTKGIWVTKYVWENTGGRS